MAASSINLTRINPSAKPNSNNWSASSYSPTYHLTPNSYLSYVKSRKEYTTITDTSQINGSGIYVYDGSLSINSNSAPFNQPYNIVLISTGTVTITVPNTTFTPGGSVAVLAQAINFNQLITEAQGIFIANNIDTGAAVNRGLKIIGNLIAQTSLTNGREWINVNKPVLFIVFDQQKYLDLLPYLSTASYEWNQSQ